MLRYILKKFFELIPTLLIIITLSFVIMHLAPGGPFDQEKPIDNKIKEQLNKLYKLDKPVYIQIYFYIKNLLKGDLGVSLKKRDLSVNQMIGDSFPKSLLLGVSALILSLSIGITCGFCCALNQNKKIDYIISIISIIGISIPLFVIGPLFQYIFSIKLKLFRTSGWITDTGGISNLVLPIITLSLPYISSITRLVRGSVLEILKSDYIRTARAKGLSNMVIITRHLLKGTMIPVISYLGPMFAGIVSGSIIIERVFRISGLGSFLVESAINRDYTLLMGSILVYALVLIIANLIAEGVHKLIDPRI